MAEGQKDKMTKEKNGKRKKLQKGQKEKITKKAKEKEKKGQKIAIKHFNLFLNWWANTTSDIGYVTCDT